MQAKDYENPSKRIFEWRGANKGQVIQVLSLRRRTEEKHSRTLAEVFWVKSSTPTYVFFLSSSGGSLKNLRTSRNNRAPTVKRSPVASFKTLAAGAVQGTSTRPGWHTVDRVNRGERGSRSGSLPIKLSMISPDTQA